MRLLTILFITACCLWGQHTSAQFTTGALDAEVPNNNPTLPMSRIGRVGIGFSTFNAYNGVVGTFPPRLLVQDGLLAHYVSGTVGTFGSIDKWCGLGVGNPGGPASSPQTLWACYYRYQ